MKRLSSEALTHLRVGTCPACGALDGDPCERADNLYACPERAAAVADALEQKRSLASRLRALGPCASPGCVGIPCLDVGHRAPVTPKAPAGKWDGINRARARQATEGKLASKRTKPEGEFLKWLAREKGAGRVLDFREQPGSLRLGDDLHYRPDFLVIEAGGLLVYYEIKGPRGWKLDPKGRVKWKAAGESWPFHVFRGALLDADESWHFETYAPAWPWPREGGVS